jgi:hypothetical protein
MQAGTSMRVGQNLSAADGAGRFVVLKTGTARQVPNLNGRELAATPPQPCSAPQSRASSGWDLEPGACYADEETGLELRCTEGANGDLLYADRPMIRRTQRKPQFPVRLSA